MNLTARPLDSDRTHTTGTNHGTPMRPQHTDFSDVLDSPNPQNRPSSRHSSLINNANTSDVDDAPYPASSPGSPTRSKTISRCGSAASAVSTSSAATMDSSNSNTSIVIERTFQSPRSNSASVAGDFSSNRTRSLTTNGAHRRFSQSPTSGGSGGTTTSLSASARKPESARPRRCVEY